jgi:hypothetical protein
MWLAPPSLSRRSGAHLISLTRSHNSRQSGRSLSGNALKSRQGDERCQIRGHFESHRPLFIVPAQGQSPEAPFRC